MKNKLLYFLLIVSGAWALLMITHEIIGHGGMVLIVGGTPIGVDGMYFEHNLNEVSASGKRLVHAAGSISNIILALLCYLIYTRKQPSNFWIALFLWVTFSINLFHSGLYIAFGWLIHPGMDWAMIIRSLPNQNLSAGLITVLGLSVAFFAAIASHRMAPVSLPFSRKRLYWLALVTCSLSAVVSSLLVPSEDKVMMLMGGIGNGFIFLSPMLILSFIKSKEKEQHDWNFNPPASLLISAGLLVLFYWFVMSPGIKF
ncbi:MAG: hypothetical protein Tsb0034_21610 [Ekhidna sp.]